MIVCVPSPPLLLPGLTGSPVPEVEELRNACLTAIGALLAEGPERIVLVGAAEPDWDDHRPLAELVGRTLLAQAGYGGELAVNTIDPTASTDACLARGRELAAPAMLVVGDGSARRGLKAPGYLDERAAPFDDQVLAALQSGDPSRLADLDPELAAELMVAGRAAWQVMSGVAEGRTWTTETCYAADPFGVFYPVVIWR